MKRTWLEACILLLVLVPDDVLSIHDVLVATTTGAIRGYARKVHEGKIVLSFTGIPYAKPPIGDLRFQKPVPVDPWSGFVNATTLPNSCFQEPSNYFDGFSGEEMWNPNTPLSEDCLYLNIWVPEQAWGSEREKLAVMVWIHGGGYVSGTSTLDVYDGAMLAHSGNVIVASLNYRLGAFGFLCLGVPVAACNQGLWDQALALKWIQDNIEAFGGDASRMTLFGESAGGGIVSALLLSPATRHFFRRGILQSGSINTPWSYKTFDDQRKISVDLMKSVFGTYFLLYYFLNIMDKDEPTLISRDLFTSLISTEIFAGMNSMEKEAIILQYTNWDDVENLSGNQKMLADIIGDYFFLCPLNFFAEKISLRGAKVYYYYFTWDPPNFAFTSFQRSSSNPWGQWMGVMHGDEIEYVFGTPVISSWNHSEIELSQRIMHHFSSFASTGNPAKNESEWPLYTATEQKYYILNAAEVGIGNGPRACQCAFWNKIMHQYRTDGNNNELLV
ncbi:unnamed protein product [Darwinula stevensoni]|uniref:Carboxylic ester hydrolase n=1 Tax=Darwinula stevensoni TaxID=69355 RepID=A0A7R8X6Z1_9CRUS|nr:unnamed protein product [Darwinula stevensoni]CAG0888637.1 unnamed protein product [Darwinula stevensoni]